MEFEGIRFGFLTCYDFYFYEFYANIARQNVDIIIGCSHQRSDSHDAIEIMCYHLAYNTNAYAIRSSVSFAEDSEIAVCVAHSDDRPWAIVDRAIELGCEKVQFFKPFYNREMIAKAHKHGIKCNVFWSDDPKETEGLIALGVDTILTNDYNRISQHVKRKENKI